MKIIDLKTYVVEVPPPHRGGRNWVFVKIITNNGIEGIGEAYGVPFDPHAIVQLIQTKPGLGVELNEEVVNKHLYQGTDTSLVVRDDQPYIRTALRPL